MKTMNNINKLFVHSGNLRHLHEGAKELFGLLHDKEIKFSYEVYDEYSVSLIIDYGVKNRVNLLKELKEAIKEFKTYEYDLKIENNFNTNEAYKHDGDGMAWHPTYYITDKGKLMLEQNK